ncbi:hypothetical protein [Paraflavitalea speifideaquila]|uniref:hypothetical protein n=1 Tax=Paraflavitalea speifideaquila TaxID=3076558 RepID=UPI0028ED3964|nr:hypothetical protein [Paraflavitalea speifideiaquila]
MEAATTSSNSNNLRVVWKQKEGTSSPDPIIDAYLKGVEAGKTEYTQVLTSQFATNMNESGDATEKLLGELEKQNITVHAVFLKADGITSFEVLFVVSEKDFVADDFRSVYTIARQIKNEYLKDNYYIAFSFMPQSNNFNESYLIDDGYSWKYAKK